MVGRRRNGSEAARPQSFGLRHWHRHRGGRKWGESARAGGGRRAWCTRRTRHTQRFGTWHLWRGGGGEQSQQSQQSQLTPPNSSQSSASVIASVTAVGVC
ncbi:hypothetical protein NDU88_004067 [Pleurodeles waltl]|uniref:Uncharacterized protein n=1 Tax=Pleurodeles waltl TaxID=8319 RepID=A0AAV7VH62_PLEWA|nr:hypothetical protein NDU88_004067 [Pleurodeles waltl]